MLKMPLTRGYETIIDDCDADLFDGYKWTFVQNTSTKSKTRYRKQGYAVRNPVINGKHTLILLHRVILERKLGHPIPDGYIVDHKNGDSIDNQRENLRMVTYAQNMMNAEQSGRSKSPYKGVTWKQYKGKSTNGRWYARITVNGKRMPLGRFHTPEEAGKAYNEAAKKYFGEFARLNDITS